MKVLAINGSPRKNHNTAALLQKALDGASSKRAQTELFHLYDLTFKGCVSCFACKLKNGKSFGTCVCQDELQPLLAKAAQADAILLGSPIYLMSVTGVMRAFMERLLFPYLTYADYDKTLFKRKIPAGFIYTMNLTGEQMEQFKLRQALQLQEAYLKRVFGYGESLIVNDTYQFDDYKKYEVDVFDEVHKARVKKEEFPRQCQKAFDMGARFASMKL